MDLRRESSSDRLKEDRTIVTKADWVSDRILREGLAAHFPDHAILTEESGFSGSPDAEWIWLVDPLDGTKAYAKGIHGFSILVGLLREGRPYLGVVIDPMGGFVYEAVRGQGAFVTTGGKRRPLHVSRRSEFKEMPLVTSIDAPKEILQKIARGLQTPLCDPIHSVGIKVGLVARQCSDIYLSYHPVHYWDTCGPQVVLEESGGLMTYLDGTPLKYLIGGPNSHDDSILATNGMRHAELVKDLTLYPDLYNATLPALSPQAT